MRAPRLNLEQRVAEGHKLIAAKATVAKGQWLKWIEANCVYTVATAQKYMREARDAQPITVPAHVASRALVPFTADYQGAAHYQVPALIH